MSTCGATRHASGAGFRLSELVILDFFARRLVRVGLARVLSPRGAARDLGIGLTCLGEQVFDPLGVLGNVVAWNISVGVYRTPVPCPTLVRSTPRADSRAAAAAARSGVESSFSPSTV
jgi:hypothetical protein